MKKFLDIVDNVQLELMDTSSSFENIVKNYVNNRYFQVLRAVNWNNIRYDYTFNTVAGTATYVLPEDFKKPIGVHDDTNNVELAEVDYQLLVQRYPGEISTQSDVARYCIVEDTVMAQPTSTSQVIVVSSSVSDTTQTVLVRGIVSSAEMVEELTLQGTSNVISTNSFSRIKAISKSASTTGKVTVTANTGAVTVAVLSPKVLMGYYKIMRLHYVPTGTYVISVPYIIQPLAMVEDNDYPVIDIGDLIEIGAKADACRYKRQFSKASVFETMFTAQTQEYIFDGENNPNKVQQLFPSTYDKDNLY